MTKLNQIQMLTRKVRELMEGKHKAGLGTQKYARRLIIQGNHRAMRELVRAYALDD